MKVNVMRQGILPLAVGLAWSAPLPGQTPAPRWHIEADGSIAWPVGDSGSLPHEDHLEMGGRHVAMIVRYGADDDGTLKLDWSVYWPMLRTIPNDTHATLSQRFEERDTRPEILVDGQPIGAETAKTFRLRGLLQVITRTKDGLELARSVFPVMDQPAIVMNGTIRNTADSVRQIEIRPLKYIIRTDPAKGVDGEYLLEVRCPHQPPADLAPGAEIGFSVIVTGRRPSEPAVNVDAAAAERARTAYVDSLWERLIFECPDPVLSRAFAFAKIRAAESVYDTKGGLMHGPGGGAYYAAIWANDQAEYANPFFAYLGDPTANESAINAFCQFARFMKPDYAPVPSSIIAEGTDIWNGAGDRGDAAMIAYGAGRYALAAGDRDVAERLWPTIQWCLEYCRRKMNAAGVVASDCDELESRFPAGKANLCTSTLTYDALLSAADLGESLGKPSATILTLREQAAALDVAMERYFGATVEGFETYRYYDGNATLRAWICIPLAMGVFDRAEGTVAALFSPRLWTDDGLATAAGKPTFWDRSTLYALRGVFAAGRTEQAMEHFRPYSTRRLLGEHVPYPVEAWPEGNQRHLSAESALYCRVVTEGLFGIRPTGLRSFDCTPRLPNGWDRMALRKMHAFGHVLDLVVSRDGSDTTVSIASNAHEIVRSPLPATGALHVKLPADEKP